LATVQPLVTPEEFKKTTGNFFFFHLIF